MAKKKTRTLDELTTFTAGLDYKRKNIAERQAALSRRISGGGNHETIEDRQRRKEEELRRKNRAFSEWLDKTKQARLE